MSDTTILTELFKPTVCVPIYQEYGKWCVRLQESSVDSEISIRCLPADTVVMKADMFRAPNDIFIGSKHECKRADYIIISEQEKTILFIEMKKEKGDRSDIVRQLGGSLCLFTYCREIGQFFWNEKGFLENYAYRFVSIEHTSVAKQRTRIEKTSDTHDVPQRMMQVHYPHYLQYNKLIGR